MARVNNRLLRCIMYLSSWNSRGSRFNRAVPALGGTLDEIELEWAYPEHRIAAFWREECRWAGVLHARAHRKHHVRYSAPWSEMLIDRAVQTGGQLFDDGES